MAGPEEEKIIQGPNQEGLPPVNGNINGNPNDINDARRGAGASAQQHATDVNTVLGIFQRNPKAVTDALIIICKDPANAAVIDRALGRNSIPSSTTGVGGMVPQGVTNEMMSPNNGPTGAPAPSNGYGMPSSQQGFSYLDPNQQMIMAQAQVAAISSVAMDPNSPADKKATAQGFMTWYSGQGNAESWNARMSNLSDPASKLTPEDHRRRKAELDRELYMRAGATIGELGIVVGGIPNYQPQQYSNPQYQNPQFQPQFPNGGMPNNGMMMNGNGQGMMGNGGMQMSPNAAYSLLPQIQAGDPAAIGQYAQMYSQLIASGMDQRAAAAMIQRLLEAQTQQNQALVMQQARLMARQAELNMQVQGQTIMLITRSNVKIAEARAMAQIRREDTSFKIDEGVGTAAAVGWATGRLNPLQAIGLGFLPGIFRWGRRQARL